jgi:hypothetical protein
VTDQVPHPHKTTDIIIFLYCNLSSKQDYKIFKSLSYKPYKSTKKYKPTGETSSSE